MEQILASHRGTLRPRTVGSTSLAQVFFFIEPTEIETTLVSGGDLLLPGIFSNNSMAYSSLRDTER